MNQLRRNLPRFSPSELIDQLTNYRSHMREHADPNRELLADYSLGRGTIRRYYQSYMRDRSENETVEQYQQEMNDEVREAARLAYVLEFADKSFPMACRPSWDREGRSYPAVRSNAWPLLGAY